MHYLSVTGVSRVEHGGYAVSEVSFEQREGEKIAIAGEAGSGKTTLLKMVAGLLQPQAGEIYFMGERVKGPDEVLIPGHKKIAYLSQHFELRNNYHVYEVLDMANKIEEKEAQKIFSICRIQHLMQRWTDELSGGEKQRIALARLLCTSPNLLLLDEPFSNLDAGHQQLIQNVLEDVSADLRLTCLMVSHDAADMLAWADRILIMRSGKIIQSATPQETFFSPKDAYCAGLFGAYNYLQLNDPALLLLREKHPGKNSLFIRPVQLETCSPHDAHFKARLLHQQFKGAYTLLRVHTGQQEVLVQSALGNLPPRAEIGIRLRDLQNAT